MDLNEIIAGIDDVSEPSSMEKVLIRFEELQAEDEEFMQLLVEKLKNQSITWEQPWYQKAKSLTRRLKETNNDNTEKFLMDTISKKENERIQKNWKKFRKQFDVPDKLICLARWKNKDKSRNPKQTPEERARRYVTAYLARGLQRSVHQVYKHIATYFAGPNKKAYSPTEEKIMEICFLHKPRHAVIYLSSVLGREPRGIYKRQQQMFEGKSVKKKRLKWTLELATKFLNLLMKYSGYSLEELKNRKIDKSVWLKLQDDFDQCYVYLQNFWYHSLYVQLFVQYDIKLNRLRKRTLKKLRSSSYQVWSDIRWKELVKQFPDGFSHRFLYRICFDFLKTAPQLTKLPLQDIVDYGLQKTKSINYKNRRLKTLTYNKEGNLERVQYNKNKEST